MRSLRSRARGTPHPARRVRRRTGASRRESRAACGQLAERCRRLLAPRLHFGELARQRLLLLADARLQSVHRRLELRARRTPATWSRRSATAASTSARCATATCRAIIASSCTERASCPPRLCPPLPPARRAASRVRQGRGDLLTHLSAHLFEAKSSCASTPWSCATSALGSTTRTCPS